VSPIIGGMIMDVTEVSWSGFLFWGILLALISGFIPPMKEGRIRS